MDYPDPDNVYEQRRASICGIVRHLNAGRQVLIEGDAGLETLRDPLLLWILFERERKGFTGEPLAMDLRWAVEEGYLLYKLGDGHGILTLGPTVGELIFS